MKVISFLTSNGYCTGVVEKVEDGAIVTIDNKESNDIINSLYIIDYYNPVFKLKEDLEGNFWILIELNDSYYGYPEYKIEIHET